MKRTQPFQTYADNMRRLVSGDVSRLFVDIFDGITFQINNHEYSGRWFHDHQQNRLNYAREQIEHSKSLNTEKFENLYIGLTEYINRVISNLYTAKAALNEVSGHERAENWEKCLQAFDRLLASAHESLSRLRFLDLVRQGLPEYLVQRFESLIEKIESFTNSMPDQSWYKDERLPYSRWLNQFQEIVFELGEIRRKDKNHVLKNRLDSLENSLQERKIEVVTIFSRQSIFEQQQSEEEAERKLRTHAEELLKSIQGSFDRMHGTPENTSVEHVAPFDPAFFSEESEILLRAFAVDLGKIKKEYNVTFEAQIHDVLQNAHALRARCLDSLSAEQKLLLSFILHVKDIQEKQEQCRADFITAFNDVKAPDEDVATYFRLLKRYDEQLDAICGEYLPLANLRIESHLVTQTFFEQRIQFKNEIMSARDYLDEWNARWNKIAASREAGLAHDVRRKSMALQAWCAPDHHLTRGPFREKIAHVLFLKYKDDFHRDATDFASSYVKRLEEIRTEFESMSAVLTDAYDTSMALVKIPKRDEIINLKSAFRADLTKRVSQNLISDDFAHAQDLLFSTNCDLLVGMIKTCETECKTLHANRNNQRMLEQLQAEILAKEQRDKIEDQELIQWKERTKSRDEELERIKSQNQQEQDRIAQLEALFVKKASTLSAK